MMTIVTAGLALAIASSPAGAEPSKEAFGFSFGPSPDATCTVRTARPVDLARLTAHPADYLGQCVSVFGYWRQRALFTVLSEAERPYPENNPRTQGHRLGLYMEAADRARIPETAVMASAIGKVHTCDDLYGPRVVMVSGYCHAAGGPYLSVSRIHALE